MHLFHVDKESEEVTNTLAHRAHVLLLGVQPLDSVLGRVEGGQGAGSFFFRELKFSGRATMYPCHMMVESPSKTKPFESKVNKIIFEGKIDFYQPCTAYSALDLPMTPEYPSMCHG